MPEHHDRPVDENAKRPLVSFVLFAYNQERYIREAVEAALAQTYSPLEIIISDDCSADDTFHVIEEMTAGYRGPHALVVRKNDHNLGLAEHINQVMALARGELVVVAAGDDISFPERVSVVTQHWLAGGRESGSIFSRFQTIDEFGKITRNAVPINKKRVTLADRDLANTRSMTVGTMGCAHAWTRDVFDFFGPINERIIHEDITIPLRSLLIGSVTFLPDELVSYRMIAGSQSRASFTNHQERIRKMARYWEGRVANYEQYRLDAQKISARKPDCRDEIDWLSRLIGREADAAQINHRFFRGGYLERFRAVIDFSKNIPVARRLKLLALAIIPALYNLKTSRSVFLALERIKKTAGRLWHSRPRARAQHRS